MRAGWRRTEERRDGLWTVQPVTAVRATKSYVCPGCNLEIAPKTPHLVAWRADGLMGEAADFVAVGHGHFGAGFFGCGADGGGGGAFAFELFACGKEVEGEKAEREGKQRAHGGAWL